MNPRAAFPTIHVTSAFGLVALAMLSGTAAAQRAPEPPAPPSAPVPAPRPAMIETLSQVPGWVGITTSQRGTSDGDDMYIGYPVIASVDPGSPAQSAGLVAGDTVLAYNDVDARNNPLGVQRFLNPGQRIVVRIRRDGLREIPLTVAKRPSRSHMRLSVSTTETSDVPAPRVMQLPMPIVAPLRAFRSAPLAGAQLAELNAGLASALNVRDRGVLVVEVMPGSPAMSSGLSSGDVIVRADTIAVTSPVALIRAMRMASDHSVVLDLLRGGKTQRVTLRW